MEDRLNDSNTSNLKLIRQEMLKMHNTAEFANLNHKEEKQLIKLEEDAAKKKAVFEKGYNLLRSEIEKGSVDGFFKASDDLAPIPIESFKMDDKMLNSTFPLAFWKNYIKKPSKIQTLMNYNDDLLLSLYSIGTHFYELKQFQEAIDCYSFLCMLNPSISSFWVALGLSLEGNNELTDAFEALEKGVELTPFEIAPYIAMIRTSEKLNDYSSVTALLNKACENSNFEEAKAALEYVSSVKK